MVFFSSHGIHPIIGILIFGGMILLVAFSFTRVWRNGPMDVEEYRQSRKEHEAQNQNQTPRPGDTEDGARPLPPGWWECRRSNCRAINPPHGRYCRMCGRER